MSWLEWLKKQAKAENILLIARDDKAKRVLVAWTIYRPKFTDYNNDAVTVEYALERLWENELDYDRLASLAGLPKKKLIEIFSRLREAFLVFPDGTISPHASAVLAAEAAGWLRPLLAKK